MNKKGFTLVELMGILVILGVLLIFTVPSITNTLKSSKVKEKEEYEKTVCLAAKSYIEVKRYAYPKTIEFSKLRSEGFLYNKLKNPETNKVDSGDRKVIADIADGEVVCTFNP